MPELAWGTYDLQALRTEVHSADDAHGERRPVYRTPTHACLPHACGERRPVVPHPHPCMLAMCVSVLAHGNTRGAQLMRCSNKARTAAQLGQREMYWTRAHLDQFGCGQLPHPIGRFGGCRPLHLLSPRPFVSKIPP